MNSPHSAFKVRTDEEGYGCDLCEGDCAMVVEIDITDTTVWICGSCLLVAAELLEDAQTKRTAHARVGDQGADS